MKSNSSVKIHEAILKYLEVFPLPTGDNVCKWYMDNLSKEVRQLGLECLFLHANKAMYSKFMMVKWLNEGLYDKIFPLLGDFHTLLVKLKILHKKCDLLGMKDFRVDGNVAAVGSADKTAEGKHYCRSTRLHKQHYEAAVRFIIMKNLENLTFSDTFPTLICDTASGITKVGMWYN